MRNVVEILGLLEDINNVNQVAVISYPQLKSIGYIEVSAHIAEAVGNSNKESIGYSWCKTIENSTGFFPVVVDLARNFCFKITSGRVDDIFSGVVRDNLPYALGRSTVRWCPLAVDKMIGSSAGKELADPLSPGDDLSDFMGKFGIDYSEVSPIVMEVLLVAFTVTKEISFDTSSITSFRLVLRNLCLNDAEFSGGINSSLAEIFPEAVSVVLSSGPISESCSRYLDVVNDFRFASLYKYEATGKEIREPMKVMQSNKEFDLLRSKLSFLKKARILETKTEEKFALDHKIAEIECQLVGQSLC
ncbi:MAG: hypothetical protein GY861_21420 [bacterium]|nr:hypothetical protein [bacterium]